MGQYFDLINLDTGHRIFLGKFGELYLCTKLASYICTEDPEYSWAGDRLILLGVCAESFPAGVLTPNETEPLADDDDPLIIYPSSRRRSWTFVPYTKTSVLRNLCTREYIRAEAFPGE